jgi:formylglycine-generating enzyme required for sulfatase activity
MGQPDTDAYFLDQSPDHVVNLATYFIDKYEVSVSQYRRCVVTGFCDINTVPSWSASDEDFWYNQARGLAPAIQIDWDDARDYCAWAGKMLPSEAQWEKAARGAGNSTQLFPWGDVQWEVPAEGGAPVRVAAECDIANHRQLCTQILCKEDVMPVDNYPLGVSQFGAFNMAGNAMEWVNDWYQANYYAISPDTDPLGPGDTGQKAIRGGGWRDVDYFIEVVSRKFATTVHESEDLGFRCARLPPNP